MMAEPSPPPRRIALRGACANCGTALRGAYCHACGQPVKGPVRHLGHAIEEVFEALWHLDARIFRTLWDLLVPGRVALRYLAGQRARYVAPMRLFVVLAVLAFFLARLLVTDSTIRVDLEIDGLGMSPEAAMAEAQSVEDVEEIRDRVLEQLLGVPAGTSSTISVSDGLAAARLQTLAAERIAELRRAGAGDTAPAARADDRATPAAVEDTLENRIGSRLDRIGRDPRPFVQALLGAAPMTLFITVPLFAVLLKLMYLFRRRLYMEHLVVGLYSHAWLMLVLVIYFLLSLAAGWLVPHAGWLQRPFGWAHGLLLWAMPLYLLVMQKRVYGQGWPMTLFKFGIIGFAYLTLVSLVATTAGLYVMSTL